MRKRRQVVISPYCGCCPECHEEFGMPARSREQDSRFLIRNQRGITIDCRCGVRLMPLVPLLDDKESYRLEKA